MRDISTAGQKVLSPHRERTDLSALVRAAVERARGDLARAGCEVRVSGDVPAEGPWDRRWLERVVANLLSNA